MVTKKIQQGFTLIELMITVAIIAVIAAIAVPSYKNYVIRTKRTDAMVELQNIATQIETKKSITGKYSELKVSDFPSQLPLNGTKLYDIKIQTKVGTATTYSVVASRGSLDTQWKVVATPVAGGQMADDGTLSLNYQGIKCRIKADTADKKEVCGKGEQWKK